MNAKQFYEQLALTQKYSPSVMPLGWEKLSVGHDSQFFGQSWYVRKDGLKVIFTADNIQGDGKTWLHVSMSRQKRLPSYEDMQDVKALFIGKDRQALQIFPAESKHINIHPFCLHLWCAVEGDGLPDFGREGTI